jgi:hypothetical protein
MHLTQEYGVKAGISARRHSHCYRLSPVTPV